MMEAQIRYDQASFRVMAHGDFVRCAHTGKPIALAQLRYWNVERQEAYIDSAAATARHQALAGQ